MAQNEIIQESLGTILPSGFSLGGTLYYVGVFVGTIILGIILAFVTVLVINYLKYNKKIVLFRRIGNEIVPCLRDKAMFARIGNAGDYWCQLKKFKKILPRPRIQMEKNTYWYYERDDGEWINFSLEDLDQAMKKASIHYVDEDMRLQRLGIQKNLRDRFQKVTFWQRYGGMIVSIVYILVVTICFVILFKSMEDAWTRAGDMAASVREMAIELRNIRTGGGCLLYTSPSPRD